MTKAFQHLAESEPILPSPGSVLPALLAMRRAHQTIQESQECAAAQAQSLEQIQRRIETEKANLCEQEALRTALENRLKSLREGLEDEGEKSEDQLSKERIAELKKQKEHWDKQTSTLMKQLDQFIEEYLGPMLAAEDLGGPVVGDMIDINPNDLEAGFTTHGKLKKTKGESDQDKRQRRIDEMWAPMDSQGEAGKKRPKDEASAAAAEMRDLLEQLMNKLIEARGDNSAAYVELPRESAAARFLVRSKVAMFDPKDARKIRLVDFGREVDS
mgnify:CR=1 FL=1|jgi:Centromere-associated protein K.